MPGLRSSLAFPGTVPVIDRTSGAARKFLRIAVVADNGNLVAISSGKRGTIAATISNGIHPTIGPYVRNANSTGRITFANNSTVAPTSCTIAGIFIDGAAGHNGIIANITSAAAAVPMLWKSSSDNNLHLGSDTGTPELNSAIPIVAGVPYFAAASYAVNGAGNVNFVVTNLQSGQVFRASVANTFAATASNGTYCFAGDGSSDTSDVYLAAAMYSTGSMSMPELMAWQADPWSFWYAQPAPMRIAAAAPVSLVLGWMPGINDFTPKPPMRFQPPPAIALTPDTLPPVVSGMAWFTPPDPKQPRPLERPEFRPAIGMPPSLLSKIQGMGWFNPPDRDKPATKITVESPPAISLTPATLPPQIAGMAWFERPDIFQPRRSFVQDAPAYAPPVVTAQVATVPYGWWPLVQGPPRKPMAPQDAILAPQVFTASVATAPYGWWPSIQDAVRRSPPIDTRAAFAFAPFAIPTVWTQPFPEPPLRGRVSISVAPAILLTPPPPPAGISGMAWFTPPEVMARGVKASWIAAAPAWAPQQLDATTTVTFDDDWLIRARRRGRR